MAPLRPAQISRTVELSDRVRRLIDIAVAILGIVLTAPLMLLVAVLVKLTSPGPVISRQHRVGVDRRVNRGPGSENYRRSVDHGGKLFTIYNFRTMRNAPERGQRLASRQDGFTTVGKILRATRIDELPQFFNVLRGDMNIVGPRPAQPEMFQELCAELSRYQRRQWVLPGVSGLARLRLGCDTHVDIVKKKEESLD